MNHFDDCKWIFADHQRLDAPSGARCFAQLGEAAPWFRERDDLQLVAPLGEQRPAEFPIAEMRREQQYAAFTFLRIEEILPAAEFREHFLDGQTGFEAP